MGKHDVIHETVTTAVSS